MPVEVVQMSMTRGGDGATLGRGLLLVVAAVGVFVAGCPPSSTSSPPGSRGTGASGAVTTTGPSAPGSSGAVPTTRATPTPASVVCGIVPTADVTVTNAAGCHAHAALGAEFDVELGSSMRWADPSSNSTAVTVVSFNRPLSGGLNATLRAAQQGIATVSAVGVASCPPSQPCPALAILWRGGITVGGQKTR